jgi:hypothetical protein
VVAFYGSLLALIASVGAILAYGKRRPIGTPITWGESIVAALVLFWVMFLAYGIVPDVFLKWADGKSLNWRSDAVGIPAGKLHDILNKGADNFWYNHERNVLFPRGLSLGDSGRGRILVSKQTIRDIIAATMYIIMLGVHMKLWALWQRRGKKAAELAKLEPTSSFGRPLVKKA